MVYHIYLIHTSRSANMFWFNRAALTRSVLIKHSRGKIAKPLEAVITVAMSLSPLKYHSEDTRHWQLPEMPPLLPKSLKEYYFENQYSVEKPGIDLKSTDIKLPI